VIIATFKYRAKVNSLQVWHSILL